MNDSAQKKWIWPNTGPVPVNQTSDSEMFDTPNIPFSETVVREAIQNSLDAHLPESSDPVTVRFSFHEEELGDRRALLQDVIDFRKKADLKIPALWKQGKIRWLVVEDSNSSGLGGDLFKRTSDFWNYWLNFGLSNKDCKGRGGRGIGRVTFLISSEIQTVIGLTKRLDGKRAACGMTMLKAFEDGNNFKATHAYLAANENGAIYHLYDSTEFYSGLQSAFQMNGYDTAPATSGLSLVIPYPHEELDGDGILAAVIEHFAPAILNKTLIVEVNGEKLSSETILQIARRVSPDMNDEAIKADPKRYLDLIRAGMDLAQSTVSVTGLTREDLQDLHEHDFIKDLRAEIEKGKRLVVELRMPLVKNGKTENVPLKAVIAKTPEGMKPVDRFFREGMSLPYVRAKNAGELDLILLVDDGELATYLNYCEGKAHLELLESKEIKNKLEEKGYRKGCQEKKFVNFLPVELRLLMSPDITKPDADVFSSYFGLPSENKGQKSGNKDDLDEDDDETPDPPPPPPKPTVFKVDDLKDGLRLRANPEHQEWPVNVSVTLAYADGSSKPSWSEFDFALKDLDISHQDCEIQLLNNKVRATNCGPDTYIEITGFDTKRELDTRIKAWKDAQTD